MFISSAVHSLFEVFVIAVAGFLISTFLWLPVAFAAFVVGRRKLSSSCMLVFVTLEIIAIAVPAWLTFQ